MLSSAHTAEAEYEKRLVGLMKRGAYLVAPLCESHTEDTRLVSLGELGVIWKWL